MKYTCAECGETFISNRSDKEAMAESEEVFGEQPEGTKYEVICEDCYNRLFGIQQ